MSKGKVSLGFGSFGAEDKKIMYSAKEGKTGVVVSASQYEQDYYKYRDAKTDTTKRWAYPSDFKNEKISLNFTQEVTDSTNLTVGYDYSKFEGMSPSYAFIHPQNYYNTLYKQEKETQNIYAKYDWLINNSDQGYVQFYHNELKYNTSGVINGSSDGFMEEEVNGLDIQQAFTTSDNNKLVVGVSWKESNATVQGVNNYDERVENTAIFVSDTWEFAPYWTLNAGVRYDDHSHAGDDTTMSAGLNKKLDEDSHIYFNWSEVFRAPTTDDLFYNGIMMGADAKGNPNLRPETGDTWTLGYASRIDEKTNFGINYFESNLEDAIKWVYNEDWSKADARNIDEQKKRGVEVSLNHNLNDNVSLNASYTYLRVEDKNAASNGFDRDRNYSPNTYRFGMNYKDGKWDSNIWLRAVSGCDTIVTPGGLTMSGLSESRYLDNSYITVDMAVTYKASDDFSIYAKAYNLFNEAYTDYVGAIDGHYNSPAQSRRFIIGAEYKF